MTEIKYGLVVQKFHNLKPKSRKTTLSLTFFFSSYFFFFILYNVEVGITFGLSPEKRCVL